MWGGGGVTLFIVCVSIFICVVCFIFHYSILSRVCLSMLIDDFDVITVYCSMTACRRFLMIENNQGRSYRKAL